MSEEHTTPQTPKQRAMAAAEKALDDAIQKFVMASTEVIEEQGADEDASVGFAIRNMLYFAFSQGFTLLLTELRMQQSTEADAEFLRGVVEIFALLARQSMKRALDPGEIPTLLHEIDTKLRNADPRHS